jgi:hypothetical protein
VNGKRIWTRLLLVWALLIAGGGHWALLQSVAWTGMIVSFSRQSTLHESVVRTFSGEAPCSMCVAIADGIQDEARNRADASRPAPESTRLFGLVESHHRVPFSRDQGQKASMTLPSPRSQPADEPLLPPPRTC